MALPPERNPERSQYDKCAPDGIGPQAIEAWRQSHTDHRLPRWDARRTLTKGNGHDRDGLRHRPSLDRPA